MARPASTSKIQRTLGGLDQQSLDEIMGMEMDRGLTAAQENRWVFEVAWEIANKGSKHSQYILVYS